jgi:hypothetical protein
MNIRSSAANLAQAAKELKLDWEQTKTYWRDVKSLEFEHKYLENVPHEVARAAAVIEEIDALLRKVRRDCE